MPSNKQDYIDFCSTASLPVFMQPWWLDIATVKGYWDSAVVKRGDKIAAVMPYYIEKGRFFTYCGMPPLTQYLGPYIIYPEHLNQTSRLAYEKEIMNELISQLPPAIDSFCQSWSFDITNWMPFYWQKFKQTTRYSYIIENTESIDSLWENLKQNIKYDIHKAEKNLNIRTDFEPNVLAELISSTFKKREIASPYSQETLIQLIKKCEDTGCGKMIFASDHEEHPCSGSLFVWDDYYVHYIASGTDPAMKSSGVGSLVLWEGIKLASSLKKKFNFEGSMIEPIELFFRNFGGKPVTYFQISKQSFKYKLAHFRKYLES